MGERVLKVALSLLAVAFFAAVGAAMARVGPFRGMGELRGFADASPRAGDGEAAEMLDVPVPPDTELTFNTRTRSGRHYRYESRLSAEGLWLFYTEQMPLQGWTRDVAFESAARGGPALQPALSFKKRGARCIIGFEEGDVFTTVVTVLVVGAPLLERSGPRGSLRRAARRRQGDN